MGTSFQNIQEILKVASPVTKINLLIEFI